MATKIAIVGAGLIGRRHIQLISESARCSLSGVVEPSQAARAFVEKSGAPVFDNLSDLLAHHRPDGIILATPNQLHAEQALLCIDRGITTLVEKPLAHTSEAGAEICAAAKNARVPILVGHHRRHSPIMAEARSIIERGDLGRLVAIVGTTLFYKAENEGYFTEAPWRKEPGGGPILINLIHEVDAVRSLCGEIVEVQAFSSNAIRGFAVEDTAAVNFRFANGALGVYMLSDTSASDRSWEHTSGENSRFALAHTDGNDCLLISGTFGSLSIPTMRLLRYPSEQDRSWHKPLIESTHPVAYIDPLVRQLAHFCDVIEGKALPLVSAVDGLQNLRVVEAIGQAARTGKPVSVAHDDQLVSVGSKEN